MRHLLAAVAALTLVTPALAGAPYALPELAAPERVEPSAEMLADVAAFVAALKSGDGAGIARGIAPEVTVVDGALELAIPRRKEVVGPHDSIEQMLEELAYNTGGDLPLSEDKAESSRIAIDAERQYILDFVDDAPEWGRDPMFKDAICTYAYRSYDQKGLQTLADALGVQSSGFFYVDAPSDLHAATDATSPVVATLAPDRLYALDYDTDAPGRWIAVHLPEGGSAFVNFETVSLEKPWAAGVCFSQAEDGHWQMSGQASTSL